MSLPSTIHPKSAPHPCFYYHQKKVYGDTVASRALISIKVQGAEPHLSLSGRLRLSVRSVLHSKQVAGPLGAQQVPFVTRLE